METELHSVPIGSVFTNQQGVSCVKGGPLDSSKFVVLLTNKEGIVKGFTHMMGTTRVTITDDALIVIPRNVATTIERLEHAKG